MPDALETHSDSLWSLPVWRLRACWMHQWALTSGQSTLSMQTRSQSLSQNCLQLLALVSGRNDTDEDRDDKPAAAAAYSADNPGEPVGILQLYRSPELAVPVLLECAGLYRQLWKSKQADRIILQAQRAAGISINLSGGLLSRLLSLERDLVVALFSWCGECDSDHGRVRSQIPDHAFWLANSLVEQSSSNLLVTRTV